MITSETFYQARCDAPGCHVTLPDDDGDTGTHWPLDSVEEALAEPSGNFDETWARVGVLTYCPRHVPGNADCTACDDGYIRTERHDWEQGRTPRWDFSQCPLCGGLGYLRASVPSDRES